MNKPRGILTLLLLIVLVLMTAGSVWVYYTKIYLPDPGQASVSQLLRWLATRDLHEEEFDLRRRLVCRLEAELCPDIKWDGARAQLTESHRDRIWKNIPLLIEPWFLDKLETYRRLPPERRSAYLDGILDRLDAVRGLGAALRGGGTDPGQSNFLVTQFFAQFPKWQEQADPQRRQQMSEFLVALQLRWLARRFTAG